MNKSFLILLILFWRGSFSQSPSSFYDYKTAKFDYFSTEVCNTSDVKSIQLFLEKEFKCSLVLNNSSVTETSTIYAFDQYKNNIEVYRAFAKVILDNNSHIMMVSHLLFTDIPEQTSPKKNSCWYYNNDHWEIATKHTVSNHLENSLDEIIIDENNQIISSKDLALYAYPPDTSIRVKIFNPDPLTSAHKTYAAPYLDYNDSDTNALNNERQWKSITCYFINDSFELSNKYLQPFKNNSSTSFNPVRRVDSIFQYTRHQHEFEDVMVFYHINTFQNYIRSLGFNMGFKPASYDAHGQFADNSMFLPGTGLIFGIGGIDDAEDAEIIIHEYSHSLRENVAASSNSGLERMAVEEGFMDYLSTSYKMGIDSFGWRKWAYWDGNNANESWFGRNVASSKLYPDSLVGDIYENGELWSSALMRIFFKLGKTTTDKLALQTFYYLTSSLSMPKCALLFIKADSALYGGVHSEIIWRTFAETHILPWWNGINKPDFTLNDRVKLLNSLNFAEGNGNLVVNLPEDEQGEYTIINNLQQEIFKGNFKSDNFTIQNHTIKIPGIYYLTIKTQNYILTKKIVIK